MNRKRKLHFQQPDIIKNDIYYLFSYFTLYLRDGG